MAHNTQTNRQIVHNVQASQSDKLRQPVEKAQPTPLVAQRDPFLKPGQQSNYIFSEADIKRVEQLRIKVFTTPLKFFLATSLFLYASKKLNLRRLIANPLKDESEFAKNDKYWRFASLNSVVMGTFGFLAFSFYRNQVNKAFLFTKYEKEINAYMKWRIQRQTKEYLLKPS